MCFRFRNYIANEFAEMFPDNAASRGNMSALAPQTPPMGSFVSMLTPPSSRHTDGPSMHRVDPEEISEYLKIPRTLIGRKFLHRRPSEGFDNYGVWEVTGYLVQAAENEIHHEYQVILSTMPEGPIPMGEEEIQIMLQDSDHYSE